MRDTSDSQVARKRHIWNFSKIMFLIEISDCLNDKITSNKEIFYLFLNISSDDSYI